MTPAEDPLVADARRVLTDWQAPSPAQDDLRGRYLAFLDQHPDASSRDLRAGHLTASTVVLDAARERVLLTLHPLAGRWFQLGGHVEAGDGTMAAAALREATEESGIDGLDLHPTPIGLDWHEVRCRNRYGVPEPSSHLDVEYVAVAPPRCGAPAQRRVAGPRVVRPRRPAGRCRRRRARPHPAGPRPGPGLTARPHARTHPNELVVDSVVSADPNRLPARRIRGFARRRGAPLTNGTPGGALAHGGRPFACTRYLRGSFER